MDAPEILADAQPLPSFETAKPQSRAKANLHSPRLTELDAGKSAELRDKLLQELSTYETDEALAVWAYRSLPLKNTLMKEDAEAVEVAYLAKVGAFNHAVTAEPRASNISPPPANDFVTSLEKPLRKRSKAHLAFVASQPCLICKSALAMRTISKLPDHGHLEER